MRRSRTWPDAAWLARWSRTWVRAPGSRRVRCVTGARTWSRSSLPRACSPNWSSRRQVCAGYEATATHCRCVTDAPTSSPTRKRRLCRQHRSRGPRPAPPHPPPPARPPPPAPPALPRPAPDPPPCAVRSERGDLGEPAPFGGGGDRVVGVTTGSTDVFLEELAAWAETAPQELEGDSEDAALLCDLARAHLGRSDLSQLQPGDLRELLLEVFPRKITVRDPAETETVIPTMR